MEVLILPCLLEFVCLSHADIFSSEVPSHYFVVLSQNTQFSHVNLPLFIYIYIYIYIYYGTNVNLENEEGNFRMCQVKSGSSPSKSQIQYIT